MPDYQIRTAAKVTCTAGTEKSLIELATPSTRRARPKRLIVGGFSVAASDPPMIAYISQYDTAATGGTGATPNPIDPAEPASLMTGGTYNRTNMPTGTRVILAQVTVPPSGTLVYDLPLMPDGASPMVAVSKILCVSALADAAGANQSVHAELVYGE